VARGTPTLVGVPYDGGSSFRRGAAGAPAAIRQALRSPAGNAWSESLFDTSAPGAWEDAGDVVAPLDDASMRPLIEQRIDALLATACRPIVLGGDHSITVPVLRAMRRHHRRLSILHLDAHPDLYDEFDGQRFSHACPFARIMEEELCDQLVQLGIRTMNGPQRAQATRFGVQVIDMRAWSGGQRPALEHPTYLSLDLDVLDPAFAPGVAHPEPGGLSVRELLTILQSLPTPVIGADLVELNPSCDQNGLTSVVAGKLVRELIAVMHANG
jgi:agmatinase